MIVKLDPIVTATKISIAIINKNLGTDFESIEDIPKNLSPLYEETFLEFYHIIKENSKDI